MTVTALLENTTANKTMLTEHGLSLYLETDTRRVLFDMGQSDRFARNAQTLGVDLRRVDTAVLSHGHYDHGGGIETFLSLNAHAPIYASSRVFGEYYNASQTYIGLSPALAANERFTFTNGPTDLGDGMTLYNMNEEACPRSPGAFGLTTREDGVLKEDTFLHEQYLLIEEHGKRILISGCSHKGIIDIVEHFAPDVLIGGFHIAKLPLGEPLDTLADALNRFNTVYYTCHCTGEDTFRYLRKRMPRLHYLACGDRLSV